MPSLFKKISSFENKCSQIAPLETKMNFWEPCRNFLTKTPPHFRSKSENIVGIESLSIKNFRSKNSSGYVEWRSNICGEHFWQKSEKPPLWFQNSCKTKKLCKKKLVSPKKPLCIRGLPSTERLTTINFPGKSAQKFKSLDALSPKTQGQYKHFREKLSQVVSLHRQDAFLTNLSRKRSPKNRHFKLKDQRSKHHVNLISTRDFL